MLKDDPYYIMDDRSKAKSSALDVDAIPVVRLAFDDLASLKPGK